jgi:hypothetical protein
MSNLQVVEVMDIMLLNMLASDTRFVRCPKPGCGNAIERAAPSGVLPTQAPDGRSLGHEHAVHMQENRFRCAACATNFCAQCSQFPYHLAKTCTEFAIEKAKIPCRFCELPLPKSRSNQRCIPDSTPVSCFVASQGEQKHMNASLCPDPW